MNMIASALIEYNFFLQSFVRWIKNIYLSVYSVRTDAHDLILLLFSARLINTYDLISGFCLNRLMTDKFREQIYLIANWVSKEEYQLDVDLTTTETYLDYFPALLKVAGTDGTISNENFSANIQWNSSSTLKTN
jgi:hypothetical protein